MRFRANTVGLGLLVILALVAGLRAAEPVSIIIVHTNDIHGGIDRQGATFMSNEFPPQLGGGASLATLVEHMRQKAREEGKGFLLIDTGDIWQGTPVGNYDSGRIGGKCDSPNCDKEDPGRYRMHHPGRWLLAEHGICPENREQIWGHTSRGCIMRLEYVD